MLGYEGDLIICTNQGTDYKNLEELKINHPYCDSIKLLKNQNNQSVFNLYKNCQLFVLPSLYEGFGIPILEASFHRKVIALSSIPVFKEITFNKHLYFNPRNPKKIAESIYNILKNKRVQKKN